MNLNENTHIYQTTVDVEVQFKVNYKFQDLHLFCSPDKLTMRENIFLTWIHNGKNLTYFVCSKFRTPCTIFERHHRDS